MHECDYGRVIHVKGDPLITKWLMDLAKYAEKWFKEIDQDLGNYTVIDTYELDNDLCGLCYEDTYYKFCELYVDTTSKNELLIFNILVHEMIHAALGNKVGHRYKFRKMARDLGVITGNKSTRIDYKALEKDSLFYQRAQEAFEVVGHYPKVEEKCLALI
jgi:hypothetical protein